MGSLIFLKINSPFKSPSMGILRIKEAVEIHSFNYIYPMI